jgi:uncharacterized protein YkwD
LLWLLDQASPAWALITGNPTFIMECMLIGKYYRYSCSTNKFQIMPALYLFIPFLFVLASLQPRPGSDPGQHIQIPEEVCLNPFEVALFEKLNSYRAAHKLPPITLSRSLTMVAQLHSRDLAINQPHKRSNCNMHSWSRNGPWSACCYTSDHRRSACMWDKPRELTAYEGDGFEIAFHTTASHLSAHLYTEEAFSNWAKSKGHNDVIVNRGTWKNIKWKAAGVGYHEGYATIWFGMLDDPDPAIVAICM